MAATFLGRAISNYESFVLFGDRLYWVGDVTSEKAENSLTQKVKGSEIYFSLSHGVPISDLEASDRLSARGEIRRTKHEWIRDNLERDGSTFLQFSNRYRLLRFIADEVFPRMVAAPLEERIDAIISGRGETKTGREIVQEALGSQIAEKRVSIEVRAHTLERLEGDLRGRYEALFSPGRGLEGVVQTPAVQTPSVFSNISQNVPLLVIGGKVYLCTNLPQESDIVISINGVSLGYNKKPFFYKELEAAYSRAISHSIKLEAFSELKEAIRGMESVVMKDVEYMPLMDLDEFRFRDIGYFRNGDIYYIFKRIPKFARQTTYDENLFVAKEFDGDGFAGELGIGLRYFGGQINYLGYNEQDGGVVYRGPIKEDAPFHSTVEIFDPVMKTRYGRLRTICHVGGYPHFPMTPDGFIQFLDYATTNFLDSFRQRFVDQHYDSEQQARLLNEGKLLTKKAAADAGYMLTNIHGVSGGQNR